MSNKCETCGTTISIRTVGTRKQIRIATSRIPVCTNCILKIVQIGIWINH